jgi:ligand-binding sensor domain-containing protein
MKKLLWAFPLLAILWRPACGDIISGEFVSWTDFSYINTISISNNIVYFGTTDGITRYQRFDDRYLDPITKSNGLPATNIRRIAVTFDDQEITIETDQGIYDYSQGIDHWFLESNFPTEYYRDSRPGTPLPRLYPPFSYTMYPEGYFEDTYFRRFDITAWLGDNFQDIFIGTWGMGAAKADDRDYTTVFLPYGLLQKTTDAIYIDGDSIWVAGNPGDQLATYPDMRYGVTLFDRANQTFTYFEPRLIDGFDSEAIYDIAGDEKNIYFAGQQGLTILDRQTEQFYTLSLNTGLPDNEATAVAVAPDSIWVGTADGLALYLPSIDSVHVIGSRILGGRFITDLKIAGGRLIIGTDQGAFYIDLARQKIGRLRDPDGSLGSNIRHISVSGDEILVSSEMGVTLIDIKTEKASAVPYTAVANGAYAAAANDRFIAAATDDGLVMIERETGKSRTFTEDDGLLSVNINALVPDGDYLWIGSEEGLTRFSWLDSRRVY